MNKTFKAMEQTAEYKAHAKAIRDLNLKVTFFGSHKRRSKIALKKAEKNLKEFEGGGIYKYYLKEVQGHMELHKREEKEYEKLKKACFDAGKAMRQTTEWKTYKKVAEAWIEKQIAEVWTEKEATEAKNLNKQVTALGECSYYVRLKRRFEIERQKKDEQCGLDCPL